MEEKENMKIVIVGHVDHGKSTLIGRLLYDTDSLPHGVMDEVKRACKELGRSVEFAYLLDQFEEERQQNITIDTTQMFFKTDKRNYVIIDAPGHVEFVKNMVTGASQAEAALLIVDANEGVQEQTKRHAYVLSMLGLKQVIVVLNKMDVIGYDEKRYDRVKSDIITFLKKINIGPSYIIPISAKDGDNVAIKSDKMNWYKGPTALEALDTFTHAKRETDQPLRYPIQDVYKVGNNRILVGRVESGTIKPGTEITFLPSMKKTKVKSIEVFEGQKKKAVPGECIGITIDHPFFIERGEVACSDPLPRASDKINAHVFWMSKNPFKTGENLLLRCATQEIECTIEPIRKKLDSSTLNTIEKNAKDLRDMEIGEVTLKLRRPAVVESFNDISELGRFVLTKGLDVSAGGIITEIVS
jgi:sulfate adenylyltransferase large subunit